MSYYCSAADVGSRLGLDSGQRSRASTRINGTIRRASIYIDQVFLDYGRSEPSRETAESTLNGATNAGDTTSTITDASSFSTSGSGNIDGDSFTWAGKDGSVDALTIATAGTGYIAGTLSGTGGAGADFAGTYTVSFAVASLSITNGGTTGYTGGTLSATGGGGSGFAGTYTASAGVIDGTSITNAGSGYTSAPTVVISETGDGSAVIAATLATTGPISAVAISAGGTGYTSAPTVVISDAGNADASITSTVDETRLTGITGVSADHATGVSVQEGSYAHILREICADLAASIYLEDEGTHQTTQDGGLRGRSLRERAKKSLQRLAHLGSA